MPSIYEEEIEAEDAAYTELVEQGSLTQPEAAGGYFPELTAFRVGGLEARLETLRRAVDSCAIPIIASLNGSTPEGWTSFAHDLEQAGAAAIELNLYRVPTDPHESGAGGREALDRYGQGGVPGGVDPGGGEARPVAVVARPPRHARSPRPAPRGWCCSTASTSPTSTFATLTPKPSLELSNPYEIRQALLWISLLSGRIGASLAATSGVETGDEVVKYLLAGADVVMTASALLRHGPEHIGSAAPARWSDGSRAAASTDIDQRARTARRRLPARPRGPGARAVHQHPDRLRRRTVGIAGDRRGATRTPGPFPNRKGPWRSAFRGRRFAGPRVAEARGASILPGPPSVGTPGRGFWPNAGAPRAAPR